MTRRPAALVRTVIALFAGTLAWGQTSPGHVNYNEYALSSFDTYTNSPSWTMQQWFQKEFGGMVVYSPYFDSRTSWYPNAYVYQDLYGILPGSWVANNHPEWILKNQWGNWLYIPWNCQGGTCPAYAGDISNPAFRAWWISNTLQIMSRGGYTHLFIDDVNMEFRVSDGWQNQVPPIDSNTGQLMTYDGWRSYVATFTEQIRAALPYAQIMENCIWYADNFTPTDQYVKRQFATANQINLERGIANDTGLTGGTGQWSVNNFFHYVDVIHSLGTGVNFQEYLLDRGGQQYGLASYFMISNGLDSIGDQNSTPDNWWSGYDVDLGTPLGTRTYNNGVYQRNFSNGIVLLGEPGLPGQWISLPTYYQTTDGNWVNGVWLTGSQGIVLSGANATPTAPPPPTPTAPPPAGVTRYLSDVPASSSWSSWGTLHLNQSVGGNPMTIAGTQYQHGLGTHAYSELHWPLYGQCTSFTATVGVDSEMPAGTGNLMFQVLADGNVLYQSAFLQSGSQPAYVNVNLTGYQNLVLVVTNGIYMAPGWTVYNDHADWANPIIVCNN